MNWLRRTWNRLWNRNPPQETSEANQEDNSTSDIQFQQRLNEVLRDHRQAHHNPFYITHSQFDLVEQQGIQTEAELHRQQMQSLYGIYHYPGDPADQRWRREYQGQWVEEESIDVTNWTARQPLGYRNDQQSREEYPWRNSWFNNPWEKPKVEPFKVGDRVELIVDGEASGVSYHHGLKGTITGIHRQSFGTEHYWNVEWDNFHPHVPNNDVHGFEQGVLKKIAQEHCQYCKGLLEPEQIGEKKIMVCSECYRVQE